MEYLISKENKKKISKEWTTETPFYFYKTTNLINGMFYYGSGSKVDYLGSGKHLIRAIKKYGKENFRIEKLRFFKTREDAFYYEDRFLKLYKVNSLVESYNLTNSGDNGTYGLKMSQESKDKMSLSKKGKIVSLETKDKMREANTGKTHSQETKDKMSAAKQNVSQETKDKMSAAKKGKPHSQESKDKIGVAHKNKIVSQETKDKMREAKQGKKRGKYKKKITHNVIC
jgi:hypothetical protein